MKIQVRTHLEDNDTFEDEEYDTNKKLTEFTDETNQFIKIGSNIYSKIELKSIKVPEEEAGSEHKSGDKEQEPEESPQEEAEADNE